VARLRDGAAPLIAGRSCPPHYGYSPRVFARPADVVADTLYVIGGLYGNAFALDTIETLASFERQIPALIFNGDFHWFDADATLFEQVQRRVLRHCALRGNVETEIASNDGSAGCGCAYPESVPDDDVERSNRILDLLRQVARDVPGACAALAPLPMHRVAQIGALRIGIVHGDAWSLAGWRFAHDALHDDADEPMLMRAFELGAVDGYACSHTCAPAARCFGDRFVFNNGAAGMANFSGSTFGAMTRVSVHPLPERLDAARLFGMHERGVWIDTLRIDFDFDRWIARFDALWPAHSPAAISYRQRIVHGPAFTIAQALGTTRSACAVTA